MNSANLNRITELVSQTVRELEHSRVGITFPLLTTPRHDSVEYHHNHIILSLLHMHNKRDGPETDSARSTYLLRFVENVFEYDVFKVLAFFGAIFHCYLGEMVFGANLPLLYFH